jgi:hypothetical protein
MSARSAKEERLFWQSRTFTALSNLQNLLLESISRAILLNFTGCIGRSRCIKKVSNDFALGTGVNEGQLELQTRKGCFGGVEPSRPYPTFKICCLRASLVLFYPNLNEMYRSQ